MAPSMLPEDSVRRHAGSLPDTIRHLMERPAHLGSRRQALVARALTAIARLPGRRLPVKGWTVVTELLHPRIPGATGQTTHRSRWGAVLRLDLDDYTQRCIYYDAFEADELNLMLGLLRPGDVMIDVGANVGIFTLAAARAVGESGVVHAFEPVTANYDRLMENVELNGFRNVRLNRAAAGDVAGATTLGIDPDMERSSGRTMSGYYTVGLTGRQASAPMVRLDDCVAVSPSEQPVRMVKMDVEGFEPRALAGMRTLLDRQHVDVLLLEVSVYNLVRHGFTIADVVRPLESAGYRLYRLGPLGWLRRWRYRGEPSVPDRAAVRPGLVATLVAGLQDLERHFNLVAVRDSHPAVRRWPALLRGSSLR
jgi:FkbM family methyltransferase